MRTNGFAILRGEDARALAQDAAERVERYSKVTVVRPLEGLEGWSGAVRAGAGGPGRTETPYLVAFSLGGEGGSGDPEERALVVHGFSCDDDGREQGEFALLRRVGDHGGCLAARDKFGTRPLYVDSSAPTCVASDHRFFADGRARLLPSGTTLNLGLTDTPDDRVVSSALPGDAEVGETRKKDGTEREEPSRVAIEECAQRVSSLLVSSVRRRVAGKRRVAVSFSGGLDSSLIALAASREEGVEVLLVSAYAAGSLDAVQVHRAADLLDLELVTRETDGEMLRAELRAMSLPFAATTMDKALWCIYSMTAREAASRGAELLMLGQLADELFGGYMKYSRAARELGGEEARKMMLADVVASGERAFIRDELAVARFTEVRFPFADEDLAEYALRIPLAYKLNEGERKVVLRRAASLMGLPEQLAGAPKKAAQYSSGVAKLVDR